TGPWLLEPIGWAAPAVRGWIGPMAYLVPPLEITLGLGLLIPLLRERVVPMAVVMHALVLGVLVWRGWNTVVWPWNVAMALLVVILFRGTSRHVPARAILGSRGTPLHRA